MKVLICSSLRAQARRSSGYEISPKAYGRPVSEDAQLSRDQLEYIEEMGLTLERSGLPRMTGRVLGALLMADPPEQSAEALATTLQASRGSISGATRMLERLGFIDRVSKPGERKDYFRNCPNAWAAMTKQQVISVRTFKEMAERGLALIGSDDPEVRLGLVEMYECFEFWERELPKVFADWDAEYEKRRTQREVERTT
jgi:DNA-binding MarR family transcriptional regulator